MKPQPVPPLGENGRVMWCVRSRTVTLESAFHVTRKSAGYQFVCANE